MEYGVYHRLGVRGISQITVGRRLLPFVLILA